MSTKTFKNIISGIEKPLKISDVTSVIDKYKDFGYEYEVKLHPNKKIRNLITEGKQIIIRFDDRTIIMFLPLKSPVFSSERLYIKMIQSNTDGYKTMELDEISHFETFLYMLIIDKGFNIL